MAKKRDSHKGTIRKRNIQMEKIEAKTGKEGLMYTVQAPSLGIVAQGESPRVAKKMFQRALSELVGSSQEQTKIIITDETEHGFSFEFADENTMNELIAHPRAG